MANTMSWTDGEASRGLLIRVQADREETEQWVSASNDGGSSGDRGGSIDQKVFALLGSDDERAETMRNIFICRDYAKTGLRSP